MVVLVVVPLALPVKHGGHWEAGGAELLRRLKRARVPFAFMTNGGGGKTELEYALDLEAKLLAAEAAAADVGEETAKRGGAADQDSDRDSLLPEPKEACMVLSYSPFKSDPWLTRLRAQREAAVLVVGDPYAKVMRVASEAYGFGNAVHVRDYARRYPTLNPFMRRELTKEAENAEGEASGGCWDENIQAICVFSDPVDFFEALQVGAPAPLIVDKKNRQRPRSSASSCFFFVSFAAHACSSFFFSLLSSRLTIISLFVAASASRLSRTCSYRRSQES